MVYSHYCRSGGMVDALDSKSNAVMCEGSSPSSGTRIELGYNQNFISSQPNQVLVLKYLLLAPMMQDTHCRRAVEQTALL